MKGSQSESVIKHHCVHYLLLCPEFFGWVETTTGIYDPTKGIFRKRTGLGMRVGVADIVGGWLARNIVCELKTKSGKLSSHQYDFLTECHERGWISAVLRSLDDCVELVACLRAQHKAVTDLNAAIVLPERLTPFL